MTVRSAYRDLLPYENAARTWQTEHAGNYIEQRVLIKFSFFCFALHLFNFCCTGIVIYCPVSLPPLGMSFGSSIIRFVVHPQNFLQSFPVIQAECPISDILEALPAAGSRCTNPDPIGNDAINRTEHTVLTALSSVQDFRPQCNVRDVTIVTQVPAESAWVKSTSFRRWRDWAIRRIPQVLVSCSGTAPIYSVWRPCQEARGNQADDNRVHEDWWCSNKFRRTLWCAVTESTVTISTNHTSDTGQTFYFPVQILTNLWDCSTLTRHAWIQLRLSRRANSTHCRREWS